MNEFRTIGDKIIIKKLPFPQEEQSMLEIIGEKGNSIAYGEVVACGDGRQEQSGKFTPMNVSIGDKVIFNGGGAGTFNNLDLLGEESEDKYLLTTMTEILGIDQR